MARRFSDLDKRALALLAGGVDPTTSQDEALRNYWTWRINPSANSHNLPAASERSNGRKTRPVYLSPFAVTLPTGVIGKVTISERSFAAATSGIKTACEVTDAPGGSNVGIALRNFTPARVYWRTGEATTSATRLVPAALPTSPIKATTPLRMKVIAYLLGGKLPIL